MKRIGKRILSIMLVAVLMGGIAPIASLTNIDWNALRNVVSLQASAAAYSGECGENVKWTFDDSTGTLYIFGNGSMTNYTGYTSYGQHLNPWIDKEYRNCIRSIVIADGVTSIGDYAFYGLGEVKSISIGNTVSIIGKSALSSLSLSEIFIPRSVTEINSHVGAFNCDELVRIQVDPNNLYFSSDAYGVLYNKARTTLIQYPSRNTRTSFSIPYGVVKIDRFAFDTSRYLQNVFFPNTVVEICDYAFSCSGLTSLELPNSLRTIGGNAFKRTALSEVIVPDGVESIGAYAFDYCRSLVNVSFPDSVKKIGFDVVRDTPFYDNKSNWENGLLYIGNHLIEAEENIEGTVIVRNGTKTIAETAFSRCEKVSSISLPKGLKTIGVFAFEDCSSISELNIPNTVERIERAAFEGCGSLESISLPSDLTEIEDDTFRRCSKLSSIDIPAGVVRIGSAFCDCSGLTSITIPDSVTVLEAYAFSDCSSLLNITLPSSMASIEEGAFRNCSSLKDVYFIGSKAQWNSIDISTGNESLKNATIHFSGTAFDLSRWNFRNPEGHVSFYHYLRVFGLLKGFSLWEFNIEFYDHALCYGMAITEACVLKNRPSSQSFIENGKRCFSLSAVTKDSFSKDINLSAADFIKCGYVYQDGTRQSKAEKNNTDIKKLYQAVQQYEQNNKNPVHINFTGGFGNHSILAVGTEGSSILVDDSNLDEIQKIEINGNEWVYNPINDPQIVKNHITDYYYDSTNTIISYLIVNDELYNALNGSKKAEHHIFAMSEENQTVPITSYVDYDNVLLRFNSNNAQLLIDNDDDLVDVCQGQNGEKLCWITDENEVSVKGLSKEDSVHVTGNSFSFKAILKEKSEASFNWDDEVQNESILISDDKSPQIEISKESSNGEIISVAICGNSENGTTKISAVEDNICILGMEKIDIEVKDSKDNLLDKKTISCDDGGNVNILVDENGTVERKIVDCKIKSLPEKTSYIYKKSQPNWEGIQLEVTYDSGEKELITDLSQMSFSEFDNTSVGKKTIRVEYNGFFDSFDVQVKYAWWQWLIVIFLFGWRWY